VFRDNKMSVLIINGPNLNLLGQREVSIYGEKSLEEIQYLTEQCLENAGICCEFFQSNAEHEIIDRIQSTIDDETEVMIINPAAFTHTSVAIRDAVAAVEVPFIEVHLSNPHTREPFRKHSYFSDLAIGVIAGFGVQSYLMACERAIDFLKQNELDND